MTHIPRIGIGGPVGSGKSMLIERLVPMLAEVGYSISIISNDVISKEDADRIRNNLATKKGLLPENMVIGLATGGCPHTAVREDPSMNLAIIEEMEDNHPELDLIIIESGGDNITTTFSPILADYFIYIIDVAGGDVRSFTHSSKPFAISSKSMTTTVATLTTSVDHGLAVGQQISVTGVDAVFNGIYTVASVPTTKTFTYARTGTAVTATAVLPTGLVQRTNNLILGQSYFYRIAAIYTDITQPCGTSCLSSYTSTITVAGKVGNSQTFAFNDGTHTYKVPSGVTKIQVDAQGGAGGRRLAVLRRPRPCERCATARARRARRDGHRRHVLWPQPRIAQRTLRQLGAQPRRGGGALHCECARHGRPYQDRRLLRRRAGHCRQRPRVG